MEKAWMVTSSARPITLPLSRALVLGAVSALLLIGYTLFRNTWPYPTGVAGVYPAVSAAWLVVGIVWVVARPAATSRAGRLLLSKKLRRGNPPRPGSCCFCRVASRPSTAAVRFR